MHACRPLLSQPQADGLGETRTTPITSREPAASPPSLLHPDCYRRRLQVLPLGPHGVKGWPMPLEVHTLLALLAED